MSARNNRILHIDGDSFFASCEIALDPKLEGRPVWVGGGRRGDGIVIAANRQAKKYGIKTGTACFEAKRLCPSGVLCRPHYDAYRELSRQMFLILEQYAPTLVPYSIDEGFLDFSTMDAHVWRNTTPTDYVQGIRKRILKEVRLPVTAGLANSAKCGSKIPEGSALPYSNGNREDGNWLACRSSSMVESYLLNASKTSCAGVCGCDETGNSFVFAANAR
jgi:nucleotidyltransferase/DNA polymerase involved in DNA repair